MCSESKRPWALLKKLLETEARVYQYRPEVLAELLRYGVRPTPGTNPELVRGFVRELYKFEIRRLRQRAQRREFPRGEYAGRVEALRSNYPVLSLLPRQFLV